jgi:hypothetical protein
MALGAHSFRFIVFLSFFPLCFALDLVEIRPGTDLGKKTRLRGRDVSSLDLRSAESFLWGADSMLPSDSCTPCLLT